MDPELSTSEKGRSLLSRPEADEAYRKLRAAFLLSVAFTIAIGVPIVALKISGWQVYLVLVALLCAIGTPVSLRIIRRDLERRIEPTKES
jgi:multisubunit Na+/H+ antiporter MnhG subunit